MYALTYSKKAQKQITKLPVDTQKRIISSLERARIRPEHFFERLVGLQVHKLRVGDYRIIADILREEIRIHVVEIGHRRKVYKK